MTRQEDGACMRNLPLLPIALLALAACKSADTTGQRSEGFAAPDRSMVYEASWNALRQQGYTPDSTASSEAQGLIVTRHRLEMQPFSGHGYREKATVRVQEVPQNANYYTVEVNVLREYNDNVSAPSNPVMAEWRGGVRVPEMENLLKSRVELTFITPDASAEFKSQHGMPTDTKDRLPGMRTDGPPPKDGGWVPASK
jgi:hypothetical protein